MNNISAYNVLEHLKETEKLPLGHYDRMYAKEAVEKEYKECNTIEELRLKISKEIK